LLKPLFALPFEIETALMVLGQAVPLAVHELTLAGHGSDFGFFAAFPTFTTVCL
jgi:hypothetical protein